MTTWSIILVVVTPISLMRSIVTIAVELIPATVVTTIYPVMSMMLWVMLWLVHMVMATVVMRIAKYQVKKRIGTYRYHNTPLLWASIVYRIVGTCTTHRHNR